MKPRNIILGVGVLLFVQAGFYLAGKAFVRAQEATSLRTDFVLSDVWAASRPVLGDSLASVSIVMFGDYECPPCATASAKLIAFARQNQSKVRFQFRNAPITQIHPMARLAAETADSVPPEHFWEAHERVYRLQGRMTSESLEEAVADLPKRAPADHVVPDYADLNAARLLGVRGTPTIFVVAADGTVYRSHSADFAIAIASP